MMRKLLTAVLALLLVTANASARPVKISEPLWTLDLTVETNGQISGKAKYQPGKGIRSLAEREGIEFYAYEGTCLGQVQKDGSYEIVVFRNAHRPVQILTVTPPTDTTDYKVTERTGRIYNTLEDAAYFVFRPREKKYYR